MTVFAIVAIMDNVLKVFSLCSLLFIYLFPSFDHVGPICKANEKDETKRL